MVVSDDGRQLAIALESGERLFTGAATSAIEELQPGESALIPFRMANGAPIMFIVSRGVGDAKAAERCTFVCVNCDKGHSIAHHRAEAQPPKIKYETGLELRNIRMARLLDGAFWSTLWSATHFPPHTHAKITAGSRRAHESISPHSIL